MVRPVGLEPTPFLLDAGTNTTVVDPELGGRLGLRPLDRVSLVGPGGARIVPRARLESLAVGSKSVDGLEVLCADLGGIRRLGPTAVMTEIGRPAVVFTHPFPIYGVRA